MNKKIGSNWIDPLYDAAGNMTQGPKPGAETTEHHYVYDAWNRLVEVNDDNDDPIEAYQYDGLHRRIVKETDWSGSAFDEQYDYYYDGRQVVEERKDEETDAYAQYLYHPYYIDARAIRWHDADDDGSFDDANEVQYYTHDANFNVTALLDDSANVLERYHYDPYGRVSILNGGSEDTDGDEWTLENSDGQGQDGDGVSDYLNPYLYTGRRLDFETGLQYSCARYYPTTLGRFTARDPGGYPMGDMNLYAYVGGRPTNAVDPSGLHVGPPPVDRSEIYRKGLAGQLAGMRSSHAAFLYFRLSGMDHLFNKLDRALRDQVYRVNLSPIRNWARGAEAQYHTVSNELHLAGSVHDLTLVHELLHAYDDMMDIRIHGPGFSREGAEALAQTTIELVQLTSLFKGFEIAVRSRNCPLIQLRWKTLWTENLPNIFTKDIKWGLNGSRKINERDVLSVANNLGFRYSYQQMAPYYQWFVNLSMAGLAPNFSATTGAPVLKYGPPALDRCKCELKRPEGILNAFDLKRYAFVPSSVMKWFQLEIPPWEKDAQ